VTSRNWLLLDHRARGAYSDGSSQEGDGGMATFDFELEFRIFEDEWTVIPLMDAQCITADWAVSRSEDPTVDSAGAEPAWNEVEEASGRWQPVPLTLDTLLLVQEIDDSPPRRVLATQRAGLYRVAFKAHVFVHSNRNLHSFSLNLLYPITSASLRLSHDPATKTSIRELSIVPAARYAVSSTEGFTDISICLPPTKAVEVKWRGLDLAEAEKAEKAKQGSDKEAAPQEATQITVVHHALHCVADGLLQSEHTLKYTLESEQTALQTACIHVHGQARVTSVTGHGVLSWKARPAAASAGSPEQSTLVDVTFKSSLIADSLILLMTTEMELAADGVALPQVVCNGVLRQTGSFGVVKAANVEVHEEEARGVARVGVEDLPEELRYQATLPIMFAYKHLSPDCLVRLSITKHDRVGVLEAVAESAFYQALVVDTQVMHHLLLVLQNSNQQYLALHGLPADARLWSLMVNSQQAQPVRGKVGALLVPLLVGTASDGNQGVQRTSVELTYLSQHEPLGPSGELPLAPPRLEVPISTFLMEVQLPQAYEVEFVGPLQEVARFSYPLPRPVDNSKGTDIVPAGFSFGTMAQEVRRTGVSVEVPRAGQLRRFQRLLVVDGGAAMAATYRTPQAEVAELGWARRLGTMLACGRRRQ